MNKKILLVLILVVNFSNVNAQNKSNWSDTRFSIAFNVGLAYRLGELPQGLNSQQQDYLNDLKSGTSYDLTILYNRKNSEGAFGLKYNLYKSKGSISNQFFVDPNGTPSFGTISDDISITFIGPVFVYDSNSPSTKHEGSLELALGYIYYENKTKLLNNYKLTGGNLGLTAGFGYKYRLFKNFSIGPQLNFVGGVLKEFTQTDSKGNETTIKFGKDEVESLWRIDLNLGAIYRF